VLVACVVMVCQCKGLLPEALRCPAYTLSGLHVLIGCFIWGYSKV